MKLVGTIEPFVKLQTVHLYDDNNKEIEYRIATIRHYEHTIASFLEDYPGITNLYLHGSATPFSEKIKEKIEMEMLSKYDNKDRIEVEII